nr:MAG: DNA pilot protein [Microviridae sp.]
MIHEIILHIIQINGMGLGSAIGNAIGGPAAGVIGAGVGTALGIGLNSINNQNQLSQNQALLNQQQQYNENLSQFNEGVQLDLWNKTNYAAQEQQMEQAGINPSMIWAKGMGAGGTTAANTVSTSQPSVSSNPAMDIENSVRMTQEERRLEAEIPNKMADTGNKLTDTQLKVAETINTKARTEMQNMQNQITDTELPNLEEIINQTSNKLRAEANKEFAQHSLTQQQVDLMTHTWNQQLASIGIENALKKAQTANVDQNTQASIAGVQQAWANIKIAQQNAMTNKDNAQTNSLNQKVNQGMLELQQKVKNLPDQTRVLIESMMKLGGLAITAAAL